MALSNIVNEPRRELTETAVGLVIFGGLMCADYLGGCYLREHIINEHGDHMPLWFGMPLLAAAMFCGFFLLVLITLLVHTMGENACDRLERHGVHLRPRQRYGRTIW